MIGVLGFDSRRGLGIFLFTTASRMALGPTQPPIQWVPGILSLGAKRPGREADHSPPSSVEVKEWVKLYLHSPNTPSWRGAQLKHRDNFTASAFELRFRMCRQKGPRKSGRTGTKWSASVSGPCWWQYIVWEREPRKENTEIISVGFWRWCISIRRIVFLDFIHRLVSQEQTKLRKLKL
jgi:hypothetical protein